MEEQVAKKLKQLDEAIGRHVRPDSYPLAIRMLKPGEPVPEGLRVPSQSLGENWIVCQSIGVARRYGWGIAVGKQDVICPLSAIAFGFRKPNDEYLKGFASVGMYCEDEAAATKLEADVWRFEPGSYDYVCVAPLSRTTFEPHIVAVYANSAPGQCRALHSRWQDRKHHWRASRLRGNRDPNHEDCGAQGDHPVQWRPRIRYGAGYRDGLCLSLGFRR
jgi:uncharacterized protein (DUF169 family)